MSVNHEVKGALARLLATENLIVEHKQISTAMFDVERRVLTLPIWNKASNDVYDMLVAHEVGHALYTPDEDWTFQTKVPRQFVNVTEDARIEKLMKRRYGGLSKCFYRGYSDLVADDFFSLKNENIPDMNLADRANLWFKIGSIVDIFIKREEMHIINMIADAETFEDALKAAEVLYAYCKKELEDKQQEMQEVAIENQQQGDDHGNSDERSEQFDSDSDSDSGEQSEDSDVNNSEEDIQKEDPSNQDPIQVKTDTSLAENLENLTEFMGRETIYVERPHLIMENVIASNTECHEILSTYFDEFEDTGYFEDVDLEYNKYKVNSLKEVNYLVKEFECRKSADSYARATVSRTGVLDTQNLHTYKWNEDLFKKVTTFNDGKNHGLVFILDWSGSMARVMLDTCKQMFNLVTFCRKVGIPFEVYAFTSEYKVCQSRRTEDGRITDNMKMTPNKLYVPPEFCLMNILSSKTKSKETEKQMKNVFRVASQFYKDYAYKVPYGWGLSGTPLNESLVALHQILPNFQRQNSLQKMHCVILTDGEAHHLNRTVKVKRPWEEDERMGVNPLTLNTQLRDTKVGRIYKGFESSYFSITETLLENLSDCFPNTNFIGIRLIANRDFKHFLRVYSPDQDHDALDKVWKKNKSVSMQCGGYKKYFAINSSYLDEEFNFSQAELETKTQIRNAFKKSFKAKATNKKILNEFISLIA